MNEEQLKKQISQNLSRLRKEQRYTQVVVAEMADLNEKYYPKLERGEKIPSLKSVQKLAKVFKVTASDIVGF